ncbi:MAG: ribosome rescue protein RqcH [Desulfurococcaceae archaeon]
MSALERLPKVNMDILDVYKAGKNYSDILRGCIIDNVYRIESYWAIKLWCPSQRYWIKVEPSVRFHISTHEPEKRGIDKIAAQLRRIRGSRIVEVAMLGWERVLRLNARAGDRSFGVVCELLPRGILALLDERETVLVSSSHLKVKDREVRAGLKYVPPPPSGLSPFLEEELLVQRLLSEGSLVRGITRGWGLPGYVAEEIMYRAGLLEQRGERPDKIERSDLAGLVSSYKSIVEEAGGRLGYLVGRGGKRLAFTAYKPLLFLEVYELEVAEGDSVELVDLYYADYERARALEALRKSLEERIEGLRKSVEEQNALIETYRREASRVEDELRAIYENYELVERILACAQKHHEVHGWKGMEEACNGVSGYEVDGGIVYVEVGGSRISLALNRSLAENVIEKQRTLGGLRKKVERAEDAVKRLLEELQKAQNEYSEVSVPAIRPRQWYERYRWTITRGGFLVIGGKDSSQNEAVVRRYLGDRDVFLHADIQGAPAVVLMTKGDVPGEGDIRDAAVIAACYSRAWKRGYGFADVFWVWGSQVSKSPPSGEYLPRGAFMVYGKRNYVRVPLELAIGVERTEDAVYGEYYRAIVGSEELVSARSVKYVVIAPGDLEPDEVSQRIYKAVVEGDARRYVDLAEIRGLIPGPSRIVRPKK